MRLSEAILLGSMMLRPLRGVVNDQNGSGCAIGMALIAIGDTDRFGMDRYWPWVTHRDYKLPCTCTSPFIMGGGGSPISRFACTNLTSIIVHLFNQHVCDGSWTIEQLADWIRSVEPEEPAETTTLASAPVTVAKEEVYAPK